jgi:hypothetical protein
MTLTSHLGGGGGVGALGGPPRGVGAGGCPGAPAVEGPGGASRARRRAGAAAGEGPACAPPGGEHPPPPPAAHLVYFTSDSHTKQPGAGRGKNTLLRGDGKVWHALCGALDAERPEDLPYLLAGAPRARSHCRFVLPLIHVTPDSLTYPVPLFLKRRCDRTLGAPPPDEDQIRKVRLTGLKRRSCATWRKRFARGSLSAACARLTIWPNPVRFALARTCIGRCRSTCFSRAAAARGGRRRGRCCHYANCTGLAQIARHGPTL